MSPFAGDPDGDPLSAISPRGIYDVVLLQAYICLHVWRDGVSAYLERVPYAGVLRSAHQPNCMAIRLRRHSGADSGVLLSAGELPDRHFRLPDISFLSRLSFSARYSF